MGVLSDFLLCASSEPLELTRLKGMSMGDYPEPYKTGVARDEAQSEAAYRSSIQAGSNYRYGEILDKVVAPMSNRLDELFDFLSLASKQGDLYLMPPVVTKAGKAIRMNNNMVKIKAQGQELSYFIIQKAELASQVPDWRQYLYLDLTDPYEIHPSILPASQKEKALWIKRVAKGWDLGEKEGEELFKSRLSDLVRDYRGMILYLELSKTKIISPPVLSISGKAKEAKDRELVYMLMDYDLLERGSFLTKEEEENKKNKKDISKKGS
jgi:hypothetical protein